jgi:hypothetical protein
MWLADIPKGEKLKHECIANLVSEIIMKNLKSWEIHGHPITGVIYTPQKA